LFKVLQYFSWQCLRLQTHQQFSAIQGFAKAGTI
jgi:hypothetical protein